ncbi:MAG: guanylate kinase [Deltaproteobacteria bacterium CG07_land_8_20_14_0_80_38_7]|nr:MAG: guanylate kinase [Deltaproteobacteria bacterium CG07_land_8_20_14_0_80_38_7]
MKKGRLIIISAPSGTGKTTVIKHFLSTHNDTIHSVSCTTRPMRNGETNGKDYHFISKEEFKTGINNGMFAEWATVHNHLYGTPKQPLKNALQDGKEVLLDLDVIGGLKLKGLYKEKAISFFLIPPTMDELKTRLFHRGTDTKEVQQLRLKNALVEMKYKDKFDYQVINDVLENACKEIERILHLT